MLIFNIGDYVRIKHEKRYEPWPDEGYVVAQLMLSGGQVIRLDTGRSMHAAHHYVLVRAAARDEGVCGA